MLTKLQLMLKMPFLALFSKTFYLRVLAMRGVGLRYLLFLCLLSPPWWPKSRLHISAQAEY